jgi:hypothetical protein
MGAERRLLLTAIRLSRGAHPPARSSAAEWFARRGGHGGRRSRGERCVEVVGESRVDERSGRDQSLKTSAR